MRHDVALVARVEARVIRPQELSEPDTIDHQCFVHQTWEADAP